MWLWLILLCHVIKSIWFTPTRLAGAKLIFSPFPLGIKSKKGELDKAGLITRHFYYRVKSKLCFTFPVKQQGIIGPVWYRVAIFP